MKHVTYTGVKLSELNIEESGYLADALKGYWVRKWEDSIMLTVVKGHAMLSSLIAETDTVIDIWLPQHKPFYANILGLNSSRRILVTDKLQTLIHEGEQIQAVFTVEM